MEENLSQNITPSTEPVVVTSPSTNQPPFGSYWKVGMLVVGLLLTGSITYTGYQYSQKQTPLIPQPTPKPTVIATPTPEETDNWRIFSSKCGFALKYPPQPQWEARTSFLPNAYKGDNPNYDYDCAYITAPDYKQGMDSREGLYLSVIGTTVGTTSKPVDTKKINPYPINTIEDYIKSVEDSIDMQPEPFKAKNIGTKTYGSIAGKYYETSAYENHANFVFLKGNTIFNVSWPKNYNGQYKNVVNQILSAFRFLD